MPVTLTSGLILLINLHKEPECIFLGYPIGTKGYLCQDFETKYLNTSRHVIFDESKFPFSYLTSPSSTPASSSTLPYDFTWFSNQLFLDSTNQPSLLGPYSISNPYSTSVSPDSLGLTSNPTKSHSDPIALVP